MNRNKTADIICKTAGLLLIWSLVSSAQAVQNFEGDAAICISPNIGCSGWTMVHLPGGGTLNANIRHRGHDESNWSFDYVGEFSNSSRCRITIGSTLLRHGNSMAMQTLDWGLIQLDPGESVSSRGVNTFYMNREQSERFQHVRLTFSGLANCP